MSLVLQIPGLSDVKALRFHFYLVLFTIGDWFRNGKRILCQDFSVGVCMKLYLGGVVSSLSLRKFFGSRNTTALQALNL